MKRYSRKKKLLYTCILLVLSIIVVEASLHVLYAVLKHQLFPIRSYDDNIRNLVTPEKSQEGDARSVAGDLNRGTHVKVVHPYLGYVRDPDRTPDTSYLGFPQKDDDPLLKKHPDSVRVAIFGGSFAEGVSVVGEPVMQSILREHGINADILTLAMGGYKQPQQLFALAYLLSHGAQFDVVVNIDGFNEVALSQADNVPKGVNHFYPRAWYSLTFELSDQVTLRQIGRQSVLQDDRRQWATFVQGMPRFSIIRNLGWRAYDKLLVRRIADINDQIRQSRPLTNGRFLTRGPDLGATGETDLYQEIADHWRLCSLLMKALCDSRGIVYIHILQPNQYFEAGRTLTEEERKTAFREDHIYRPGVVSGYPMLLAAKDDLLEQDVNFHDLTMIFHDIPRPIYQDDCCHPNKFGHGIIAKYIAQVIAEEMTSQSTD